MEKTHGSSVTSSKYNYGCHEQTKTVLSQMSINTHCPGVAACGSSECRMPFEFLPRH